MNGSTAACYLPPVARSPVWTAFHPARPSHR